MRIKVVLSRETLNLLWMHSNPDRGYKEEEIPLAEGEAIVELDEDVVAKAIDLFDSKTFDEGMRNYLHTHLGK